MLRLVVMGKSKVEVTGAARLNRATSGGLTGWG